MKNDVETGKIKNVIRRKQRMFRVSGVNKWQEKQKNVINIEEDSVEAWQL